MKIKVTEMSFLVMTLGLAYSLAVSGQNLPEGELPPTTRATTTRPPTTLPSTTQPTTTQSTTISKSTSTKTRMTSTAKTTIKKAEINLFVPPIWDLVEGQSTDILITADGGSLGPPEVKIFKKELSTEILITNATDPGRIIIIQKTEGNKLDVLFIIKNVKIGDASRFGYSAKAIAGGKEVNHSFKINVESKPKKKPTLNSSKGVMDLKDNIKKVKPANTISVKEYIKNCSFIMKSIKIEKKNQRNSPSPTYSQIPSGFQVVNQLSALGNILAKDIKRKGKSQQVSISSENIAMDVSVSNTKTFTGYKFVSQANTKTSYAFPETSNSISLSGDFNATDTGNVTIISILYNPVDEMISNANSSSFGYASLNSKVFSTTVNPAPTSNVKVELVLELLRNSKSTDRMCVFWQYENNVIAKGKWSDKGCIVFKSNTTHTVCHCNHLTNFAVLFRVSESTSEKIEDHKMALTIISLVGCLISTVCCGMTIIALCVFRKLLRSPRNVIHLNLAVSLLIANVIFLISGKVVEHKGLCMSASIGLFFFFLAAFCWMLSEGIHIWIMVVKVFAGNLKIWHYLCIGWGIPLVVVVVTSAILRGNIVAENFCWLNMKSGAIWSFVAPALTIVLVNFCILIKALCVAVQNPQADDDNTQKVKVSARLTIILLPILGLTWIFGIFSMNENTIAFEYLFTIFNSLQGVFIFIFYILYNGEVKKEYNKWSDRREDLSSLPLKPSSSAGRRATDSRTRSTGPEELEFVATEHSSENQKILA